MWRGAQSVINGRNAMAGQINIYTRSPWAGERLRLMAGYGRGNTWRAGGVWRTRLAERVATSVTAYMRGTDGFFRNAYNNARIASVITSIALSWSITTLFNFLAKSKFF